MSPEGLRILGMPSIIIVVSAVSNEVLSAEARITIPSSKTTVGLTTPLTPCIMEGEVRVNLLICLLPFKHSKIDFP